MHNFKWQNPIFILGNPRSGTSLLRLMLDTHSRITIPPESHFFLWLEAKYKNWKNELLDQYIKDLYQSTKFETWEIDKNKLKVFLLNQNILSYAHLNSLIYYYYASLNKDVQKIEFWGDKNSLWNEKLEKIKANYPNALFVHIVRDGRDVACSYKSLNKKKMTSKYAPRLSDKIEDIAKIWTQNNLDIEDLTSKLKEQNHVQIRYEDLLTKTEQVLDKILKLLNLELQKQQLEYYNRPIEKIEPKDFLNWKEKLNQPPIAANIGKYKNELSKTEIEKFNTIAKKPLLKYGYL